MFNLSHNADVTVVEQGHEKNPIIIIDHAIDDPEAYIDDAAGRNFTPIGQFFPGIRTPTSIEYLNQLTETFSEKIAEVFNLPRCQWKGESFYSLVTMPPSQLLPMQRIPHHDGVQEDLIAVLHYLSPTPQGGTAFFRHKTTGFESITSSRVSDYNRGLESDVRQYGVPSSRYIEDGAPMFERIGMHEGLYNRMLIYRGVSLHSGMIDNNIVLNPDPRQGRLTINSFLEPA